MTARRAAFLNYAAYQIGWLAAVFGAASGYGRLGAAVALLLTLGHVLWARQRAVEAALVVLATGLGYAVERWQLATGTYAWLADAPPAAPPLWLLALWAQFATTFRMSLAAVMRHPALAAVLGVAGGPVAFLAGERIGAAVLGTPLVLALLRLAVAWGVAMGVLAVVVRLVDRRAGMAGYRAESGAAGGQTVSSRNNAAT